MKWDMRKIRQQLGFSALRLAVALVLLMVLYVLYDILSKGGGVIGWEFITAKPRKGMTEGGIWPAVVGTFWVSVVTISSVWVPWPRIAPPSSKWAPSWSVTSSAIRP